MVVDRSPRLDLVFHALAHPARRAIIRQLSGGERNLSELASPLKMTFPAATKHVRVLERAKLVRRRVVGHQHLCRCAQRHSKKQRSGPSSSSSTGRPASKHSTRCWMR